ncbi:unnamed protein product [Orchesella dallaii]|uniref:Uncharacterized protein n=1 Tax=Orchesella dallaii TaxID=48710 RepID=A0ABP1RJU7_9HEXA
MKKIKHLLHIHYLILGFQVMFTFSTSSTNTRKPCTILPAPIQSSNSGNRPNETLQQILINGINQLPFETHSKTAIFIMGNTGSGKTTLTQTLSGNLSQLHAVRTHTRKLVVIDDNERIGLPTTKSKTLVPEYIINSENNVSFYDCPGFDDTRGADKDIAAMYFLNLITEHVEQAKFLFLVTHSSVTPGNDRLDFDLLVTHAARFLQNINKFNNSIGLIVTKVYSFSEFGERLTDDEILFGIVGFIQEFQITLIERLEEEQRWGETDRALWERKIQFVDAILKQDDDDGQYSKIWFVRNPSSCGSYSEIPYVLEVRRKISDLYTNKLKYSSTTPTDFGFTLKDKTLLKIKDEFVPVTSSMMTQITSQAMDELLTKYQTEFTTEFDSEYGMENSMIKINQVSKNLQTFASSSNNQSLDPLSDNLRWIYNVFGYDITTSYLEQIEKYENVLRFYEKVTMTTIPQPSLDLFISKLETTLAAMETNSLLKIRDDYVPATKSLMTQDAIKAVDELMTKYRTEFETEFNREDGIENAITKINQVHKSLQDFQSTWQTQNLQLSSEKLKWVFNAFDYAVPTSYLNGIIKCEELLQLYEKLTSTTISQPAIEPSILTLERNVSILKTNSFNKILNDYAPQISALITQSTTEEVDELMGKYQNDFSTEFNSEYGVESTMKKITQLHNNLINITKQNLQNENHGLFSERLVQLFDTFNYSISNLSLNEIKEHEKVLEWYETATLTSISKPTLQPFIVKLEHHIGIVKTQSLKYINDIWIPEILSKMSTIITSLSVNLEETFMHNFYSGLNRVTMSQKLEIFKDQFLRAHRLDNKWRTSSSEYNSSSSQKTILSEMSELFSSFDYSIPEEQGAALTKYENLLDIFGEIRDLPVKRNLGGWLQTPTNFIQKLESYRDWYNFVAQTDAKLRLYTTQTSVLSRRAQEFGQINWKTADGLQVLQRYNAVEATNRIRDISTNIVTDKDKLLLNDVIQNGLSPTTVRCIDGGRKALVTGNYVKFSDFIPLPRAAGCNYNLLQELTVFASEVLFFDKDLVGKGKNLTMRFIADTWEVIRNKGSVNRLIDLSGSHGKDLGKASNGLKLGEDGKHGQPGEPGGNGGNFYGIYRTAINGQTLNINVSGGNGGNGQNGGNGKQGRDGRNATYDDLLSGLSKRDNGHIEESNRDKGHTEESNRDKGDIEESSRDEGHIEKLKSFVIVPAYAQIWQRIYGVNGTAGGNGGNGGISGLGGFPGFGEILQVGNYSHSILPNTTIKLVKGKNGSDGQEGQGANGGKHGNQYRCLRRVIVVVAWRDSCESVIVHERAPNGSNGIPGGNSNGRISPVTPKHPTLGSETITAFKKFILKSRSLKGRQFVSEIDEKREIKESYVSVYTFGEELINLESIFYTHVSLPQTYIYEYQDLLRRIDEYIRTHDMSSHSEHHHFLNLLRASAFSKLVAINQHQTSPDMVINVADYFKTVKDEIQRLKAVQTDFKISQKNTEFKAQIQSQIREAYSIIHSDVLPTLSKLEINLEETSRNAINELKSIHDSALETKDKLKNQEEKMKQVVIFQKLLHGLNLVGMVASFFGPKGIAISAAISAFAPLGSALLPGVQPLTMPEQLSHFMGATHGKFMLNKSESVPFIVQLTQKLITEQQLPHLYIPLFNFQGAYMNLLNISNLEFIRESIPPDYVLTAHQQFDLKLQELIDSLVTTKNSLFANQSSAYDPLENLIQTITIANTNYPLVATLKPNPAVTSNSDESPKMRGMNDLIKNIENRKQAIYHSVIPIVKLTKPSLSQQRANLSESSAVALKANKLNVQGMLKDVKLNLQGMLSGTSAAEGVVTCVDKLDNAMAILIDLYDQIDKYEEKKELADYIASVNSQGSFSSVNDPVIKRMSEKVLLYVKTNLFLYEYKMAVGALKQWAFPLASRYLMTTELQGQIQDSHGEIICNCNLERTVNIYLRRIEHLSNQLEKYKATVVGTDEILFKSNFTHENSAIGPFYTWKNDEWQHSIEELLSGKPVLFNADIWKSEWSRGAIKFKTIELYLRVQNLTMQNELMQVLNHYHLVMIHGGISYYKFLDNVFVIRGKSQRLEYSFRRTNSSTPINQNMVVSKFKSTGDYLLSPFTYWTFQLLDKRQASQRTSDLVKFAPFIDLELQGDGMYIDESSVDETKLLELNVNEYYTNENIMSGTSNTTSNGLLSQQLKPEQLQHPFQFMQ